MAVIKLFRGRPVKKMSQTEDGHILLVFYAPKPGDRGARQVVTQEEWDAHGEVQPVTEAGKPNVRELAARFA